MLHQQLEGYDISRSLMRTVQDNEGGLTSLLRLQPSRGAQTPGRIITIIVTIDVVIVNVIVIDMVIVIAIITITMSVLSSLL